MHQAGGPVKVGQDLPPATIDQGIADHAAAAPVTVGLIADALPHVTANATIPVLQQTLAGCAVLLLCQES